MGNPNPKVSIILPTYQRASVVGTAVSDLLAQSLSDFELLVMDDGSTDNTSAVVQAFDDPRLIYLRREHVAIPGILNEAWERCRGEYLIICHDTDRYDSRFLEELAGLLNRHPSAAYAHCGIIEVVTGGMREIARHIRDYPELIAGHEFLVKHLLPAMDCPVPAISLVRRSMLQNRFHDPQFGGCSDVELWMRLCLVGDAAYTPQALLTMRQRDRSSTYYYRVHHLTELVLRAKRLYLPQVEDESRRAEIERGWKRQADRTALACCFTAYRDDRMELLPEIQGFVQRQGTATGALVVRLLRATPGSISCTLLKCARSLRRLFQEPVCDS